MRKINVLHLFVVPVITFLVCNSLSQTLIHMMTDRLSDPHGSSQVSMILLMTLYGLYIHFFMKKDKRDIIIIGLILMSGFVWLWFSFSWIVWLGGFVFLFSLMRTMMLNKNLLQFFEDIITVVLGVLIAIFLYPISFSMAVASFLVVQIIFEFRQPSIKFENPRDKFRDNLRLAREILNRV